MIEVLIVALVFMITCTVLVVMLIASGARDSADHDSLEVDGDDPRLVEAVRKELQQ